MAKTCVIKLKNEVDAIVNGLTTTEYRMISDEYSVFVPNYMHMPKFKAKRWDGKVRFFTRNGKVSVKLLPKVIPTIISFGYKIKINDLRKDYIIDIPEIDKFYLYDKGYTDWILAPHQVEIINSILSNRGGLILAGTGAGKTLCCYVLHDVIHEHCGFKTLVIVPTKSLIHQTVEEFKKFTDDVGIYGDSIKDINKSCVVSTWQTLQNDLNFVTRFNNIIMDECHGSKNFSTVLSGIMNEQAKNCVFRSGMTGTLPPDDCGLMTVKATFGDVLYEIRAKELIDIGWLAELQLYVLKLKEDFSEDFKEQKRNYAIDFPEEKPLTMSKYLKMRFPDYESELEFITENKNRNELISDIVISKMNQNDNPQNTVILVNRVAQGKALEELIPGSKFIYGKDATKVRKEMFNLFKGRNDVIMITTFGLAAVGLNIKRIFNIFGIDGGKSFIQIIQTIGRGLRKHDDKFSVNFFDVCSSTLGIMKDHLRERKKHYKKEGHEIKKEFEVEYTP